MAVLILPGTFLHLPPNLWVFRRADDQADALVAAANHAKEIKEATYQVEITC